MYHWHWHENEEEENEDDLVSSSFNNPNKPRVDRFLSIVEIPPEIVWLTQQKFAKQFQDMMEEIDENNLEKETKEPSKEEQEKESKKVDSVKPKKTTKQKKKKTNEKTNKNNFALSGLTQEMKAQIIKDIIRNYDIELFIKEARARDVIQIEIKKKLTFFLIIENNLDLIV